MLECSRLTPFQNFTHVGLGVFVVGVLVDGGAPFLERLRPRLGFFRFEGRSNSLLFSCFRLLETNLPLHITNWVGRLWFRLATARSQPALSVAALDGLLGLNKPCLVLRLLLRSRRAMSLHIGTVGEAITPGAPPVAQG